MIVEFDGEGEEHREERLTRVFTFLAERSRIKIRRLHDHEGHLSVYAVGADAIFCGLVQAAWECEIEYSFDVFDIRGDGNFKCIYSTDA
jgi:hypothetical protein